jgi:hypothetical protein
VLDRRQIIWLLRLARAGVVVSEGRDSEFDSGQLCCWTGMSNLSLVKRQEVHAKAKHRATLAVRLRLERGGMTVA